MQLRITTPDVATTRQVEQVLQFYLTSLDDQVERMDLAVEATRDPLDNALYRCAMSAILRRGGRLEVEEVQGDMMLAVNRVLTRSARTLQRRRPTGSAVRSA